VRESYYRPLSPQRSSVDVTDRLECTFQTFLFPLDCTITCEAAADLSDPKLLAFDLEIAFHQAGRQIATVRIAGSAFDRKEILSKEAWCAQRAFRHALENLPRAPNSWGRTTCRTIRETRKGHPMTSPLLLVTEVPVNPDAVGPALTVLGEQPTPGAVRPGPRVVDRAGAGPPAQPGAAG
jgi:hypothetical protein